MNTNKVVLVFLLLLSILITGCRSSEPESGENAGNRVITGETTANSGDISNAGSTTSESDLSSNDQKLAKTKFENILSGNDSFFDADQCKEMTIEEYCNADVSMNLNITKYALADLDGNSIPELVLWITTDSNNDYGFLVIRHDGKGGAVGYNFTYRQMIDLKKDGTFGYSGGIADSGYAQLTFTGNSWDYTKLGNIEENDECTATFFWNGQAVSQDAYWSYAEKQDAKECVEWMRYPSNRLTGSTNSEPESGENVGNSVITGETTAPASAAIEETQNSGEINMIQVLQNQSPFYSLPNGESMTLEEYCAAESERMGLSVSISQYTFVDLDHDNIQETVVDFRFGENDQVMCMVLKWDINSEIVSGTEFYYRQMSQIKEDGTFAYSGEGDQDGWARLRWDNNAWAIETVEDSSQKSDVQWYSYPVIVLPLNADHIDSGSE